MNDTLIIDENNFSTYFRDCRTSQPERGDVIACWTGKAEFIDGQMKKDVIDLLLNKDKAFAATQVMRKLGGATQKDCVKVCKEIALDLTNGMSKEEVEQKIYEYKIELFYYAKKEFVPIDDPHWSIIGINNLDEFLDQANQRLKITSKIIESNSGNEETEAVNGR